ncbi:MAG: hypothetical protein ACYDGM_12150 [Vulcanimicrobiaceae bacterium]
MRSLLRHATRLQPRFGSLFLTAAVARVIETSPAVDPREQALIRGVPLALCDGHLLLVWYCRAAGHTDYLLLDTSCDDAFSSVGLQPLLLMLLDAVDQIHAIVPQESASLFAMV